MHVEQCDTPQGNFTILPTEVANLPTETGSGVCVAPPTPPLAPGLEDPIQDVNKQQNRGITSFVYLLKKYLDNNFLRTIKEK